MHLAWLNHQHLGSRTCIAVKKPKVLNIIQLLEEALIVSSAGPHSNVVQVHPSFFLRALMVSLAVSKGVTKYSSGYSSYVLSYLETVLSRHSGC